mgnify:CR=1 FL=1
MGLPEFTEKIEYVFLCLILIFLETKTRKDQFILSGLIDYIQNLQIDIEMNDIVIDDRLITKDDRIGWEDTRYVSIKRYGDTDYITKYGSPQCIGYCATKYKKLQEVFNFQNLDRNSEENNEPILTKKLTSPNK